MQKWSLDRLTTTKIMVVNKTKVVLPSSKKPSWGGNATDSGTTNKALCSTRKASNRANKNELRIQKLRAR